MLMSLGSPLGLLRLFLITPHEPDCDVRTPATRIRSACLAPERGKSSFEHRSCNWSLDKTSNFSGVSCLAS